MTDISMQYLGMKLSGPIVVASTPLSESIDNVRHMEDAGAAAIVLTSLFEEQLALESRTLDEDLSRGTESFAESLGFLPELSDYRMSQDGYLEHVKRAGEAVDIPIIASLNGATPGGWVRFAREMEQAGADAIELNTFALATDRSQTSAELELQLLELVDSVCKAVKVPVAVKLSQSFTSLPHLCARLEDAGARAMVLFNRFYQPDFDIETLEVRPSLHFSTPSELLPRLHWAAILYGHLNGDIADHRRRAFGRRCVEGDHGRRQRNADGLGAAHSRHRAHRPRAGRPALLAREARVCDACRNARLFEPPLGA